MALSAKRRKALPRSAFVYPKQRKYPIDTKKRAAAAIAYGARHNTFGNVNKIKAAVHRRYPSMKKNKKGS